MPESVPLRRYGTDKTLKIETTTEKCACGNSEIVIRSGHPLCTACGATRPIPIITNQRVPLS